MASLGISIGASTISIVELKKTITHKTIAHEGNPRKVLKEILPNLDSFKTVAVTGRKFIDYINLPTVTEPEATEAAYNYIKDRDFNAIVSAGGETFMVYALQDGRIVNVYTGNKCASGTGEFFLQQIRRMDLSIENATKIAQSAKPHRVTGRCSVFCKSDCTHALNKGIPKPNVTAGLCRMMADKIAELLKKTEGNIMVVGGTSQNPVVMKHLKKLIPNIEIPKEAPYFEALGAAIYAKKNKTKPKFIDLFSKSESVFNFLKPLTKYTDMVDFKTMKKSRASENDECILGLDVGSTTTKAVLLRISDNSILADCYLRTNGDPIRASRECYKKLSEQIQVPICITGLGVTGSGRHIAGLHALTNGIINEIIAHATAAVYFDKDVDTIFEIGGQDAKYTYITGGVPSDYAMNEACSAGTGSFLEESASESLGVELTEIAEIAMKAKNPPNFNDQCAAFISSDIMTASQEGISKQDIVAALVYSVCMNYDNRVKGNRPMGKRIFMQGGVCYNKAVPIAMAALTKKKITVPPEPGLMGAFGVALEIKDRQNLGLLQKQDFDLNVLANREVIYKKSFVCGGGAEKCDRKCEVMTIEVQGKTYPFGGACDKYYNQRLEIKHNAKNLVNLRQELIFTKYAQHKPINPKYSIGISKSFLTNTFYPLYYNFFSKLGMQVILSDTITKEGCEKKGSAFCYPAEISHGLFDDLIKKQPDYIFLPIVLELPIKTDNLYKKTCVFVQAEHSFLRTAFKTEIPIFSPVLNFSDGFVSAVDKFIGVAQKMGFSKNAATKAFEFACDKQNSYFKEAAAIGKKFLKHTNDYAVVLFGRSYNAFADEANMGIPHKFATRGVSIIPSDFLPYETEKRVDKMYWGMGQLNLMAAKLVKKNPKLFGAFITNFSCGPDSFVLSYFRDIMGIKPSLTLELDSHTADAGLNTRIDAFIDIINRYQELNKLGIVKESADNFVPAEIVIKEENTHVCSGNKKYLLTDKNVTVLVPSMGRFGTEALTAVLKSRGINAVALEVPDMDILKIGRANTSCKECLPMQLTIGSFLSYIEKKKDNEIVVCFMPEAHGPCRFGQYNVYINSIIKKYKLSNVAVLTLSDEKGYAGLGTSAMIHAWKSAIIADVITDIRNALYVLAYDRDYALSIVETEWKNILDTIQKKHNLDDAIMVACEALSDIKLTKPFKKANKVSLIGEIFVRRDELSQQGIIEELAKRGIVTRVAPAAEYAYYANYMLRHGLANREKSIIPHISNIYMKHLEKKIKKLFTASGLYDYELIDIDKTIKHARHLMNRNFGGEAIVTTGLALREILHSASGIISIGPFACMPSRVAEAVLSEEMTLAGKARSENKTSPKNSYLPFLAIETDGNPYPQVIQARLETFCLQADRLHKYMRKNFK